MILDATQNVAKASTVRSSDGMLNNCCAKTIPIKTVRFFVHWRGRIVLKMALSFCEVLNASLLVVCTASGCCVFVVCTCTSSVISDFFKSRSIPSMPCVRQDKLLPIVRRARKKGGNKLPKSLFFILHENKGARKGNAPPIPESSPQASPSYGRGVPLAGNTSHFSVVRTLTTRSTRSNERSISL